MQVDLIQASEMMRIQQTAKSGMTGGDVVSFAQVQEAVSMASEEVAMDWFGKRVYQELAHTAIHRSISRGAVDISPEALRAMKTDPHFRRQVLDMIGRDLGRSYYPRQVDLIIHVGATLSEYRTQSWTAGEGTGFTEAAADSFFRTGADSPRTNGPAVAGLGAYRVIHNQASAEQQQEEPARHTTVRHGAAAAYRARAYNAYGMMTAGAAAAFQA